MKDYTYTFGQSSFHLVCFTNNNLISDKQNNSFVNTAKDVKKDFVIVFLL